MPRRAAAVVALALAAGCSRRPVTDASSSATVPRPVARPVEVPSAPVDAAVSAAPPQPPQPPQLAPSGDPFERAVPPLSDAVVAHVRTLFGEGHRAGNRPEVFAKIGDSITESGSFANDLGHGWYELGEYTRLERVIAHFRRRASSRDREMNSFTRGSLAATAGWTTESLLEGGDNCPVERELRALRPAFAVLMVGTNDAERVELDLYERNLGAIIGRIEARSVVTIISTIPEQRSSPEARAKGEAINAIIRRVAVARSLPLIDYHAAMAGLPNAGLCDDNVHPSIFSDNGDTRAGVFTAQGLRFGYNVRNLTLLLALERVTRAVGVL